MSRKYLVFKAKYRNFTLAQDLTSMKYVARNAILRFEAKTLKELTDAIEGYLLA